MSLICRLLDGEHLKHFGLLRYIDPVAKFLKKKSTSLRTSRKKVSIFPYFLMLFLSVQFDTLTFFSSAIILSAEISEVTGGLQVSCFN